MKMVEMTFKVRVPLDLVIDEKTLKQDFDGDISRVARMLQKEEGCGWWDCNKDLQLIQTQIIEVQDDGEQQT